MANNKTVLTSDVGYKTARRDVIAQAQAARARTMLLLALLLAGAGAGVPAEDAQSNKTKLMVEKIRRQLMEDNYDYLPSESELVTPAHAPLDRSDALEPPALRGQTQESFNDISNENDRQNAKVAATYDDGLNEPRNVDRAKYDVNDAADDRRNRVSQDDEIRDYDADDDKLDYFVPRAKAEDNVEDKGQEPPRGHVVSKKDLLYYVDDERLRGPPAGIPRDLLAERASDRSANPAGSASMSIEDFVDNKAAPGEAAGASPRYKVIKVNRGHGNRRSQAAGRFIQEESSRGVALISLDGQPFPEFHLPRARRQYMHDRSAEPGEPSQDPGEPSQDPEKPAADPAALAPLQVNPLLAESPASTSSKPATRNQ